jgi:glucose/arabinose dehydrogenase
MRSGLCRCTVAIAAAGVLLAGIAAAQDFSTVRVATGLDRPVFLTAPPGDRDRIFVVEQHTGEIRIIDLTDGSINATPFLTVTGLSTGNEQGLLGLAFHPDYGVNGYFYAYFTDPSSNVVRYQVSGDPDVADASSETPVLSFSQPAANHNAGWIGFGPDGTLYIASGDGGGSDDNDAGHTPGTGNAQDITDNLLGKVLRIDVDGDDFPADQNRNYAIPADNPFVGVTGDDEIWAYGLRNPWRMSFDRATGDLYIADVGQGRCEELDVQPGSSDGGENYGWRLREGTIATPTGGVGGPPPPGSIDPIFDYPHPNTAGSEPCSDPGAGFEGRSITGGTVYRGPIQELQGRYFFADYVTADLWSLRFDGSDPSLFDGTNYTDLTDHSGDPRFIPDAGTIASVSSFGEDDVGNLYVLDLADGEVFFIPEPSAVYLQLAGVAGLLALAWIRNPKPHRAPARQRDQGDR